MIRVIIYAYLHILHSFSYTPSQILYIYFHFYTSSSSSHAQYFLLPVLLGRSILACVLSNTLYALATVWYAYISHLGYRGECEWDRERDKSVVCVALI